MHLKSVVLASIKRRWTKLIENPQGFPESPPKDLCWTWTGSVKPPAVLNGFPSPRARFVGNLVNPRAVLYALHVADDNMMLKPECKNPLCINPLHQRPLGLAREELPQFDPMKADWQQLFKDINLPTNLTPEEIVEQVGCPIEAAQQWSQSVT